ncbi:MAG: HD domain-containing protein [Proteobacteria bacterium]|nr:HD domain-containing protein [Pseudomonadota bacterium]
MSRPVRVADLGALGPDVEVTGRFVVAAKNLLTTRNGNPYLALTLGDKTGTVEARVWDLAEAMNQALDADQVVEVTGRTSVYQGQTQIIVANARLVPADEIDPADFLPASSLDQEAMWRDFEGLIGRVAQPELQAILMAVFGDADFAKNFCLAPAAKRFHHAHLGGLLEHTLSVGRMCLLAAGHYAEANAGLLLTGALLHDVGKVEEFDYELKIDYSDAGRLVGHIVLGANLVEDKCRTLPEVSDELRRMILHLILSHHGSPEFGSPVRPATLEAMLLHHLDDLDAKIDARGQFLRHHGGQEGHWSPYNNLMERFFYIGPDPAPPVPPSPPARVPDEAADPEPASSVEDDDTQAGLFEKGS